MLIRGGRGGGGERTVAALVLVEKEGGCRVRVAFVRAAAVAFGEGVVVLEGGGGGGGGDDVEAAAAAAVARVGDQVLLVVLPLLLLAVVAVVGVVGVECDALLPFLLRDAVRPLDGRQDHDGMLLLLLLGGAKVVAGLLLATAGRRGTLDSEPAAGGGGRGREGECLRNTVIF